MIAQRKKYFQEKEMKFYFMGSPILDRWSPGFPRPQE
jgi:hypothetical protein